MTFDRQHPLLEPQPMTPAQVRDLVERVRAKETPGSRASSIASTARWAKWRREQGR